MQRVYKLLNKDFENSKKILELNPNHQIILKMNNAEDMNMNEIFIQQLYENALLIEGLHPDPASMINRIQQIIEKAIP
jgi:molecular chaperone HtpG